MAIGMAWLIWGAYYYEYPDWDLGVCIVMKGLTYFLAPISVRIVWEQNWIQLPIAVFFGWICVDGSYWAWHSFAGNDMLRDGQWQTSLCQLLICGLLWIPKASLSTVFLPIANRLVHKSEVIDEDLP